jgi:hypothetical protein
MQPLPDVRHSAVISDIAIAMVEAVKGLVVQGQVPESSAVDLLYSAIDILPSDTQPFLRFEAYMLWMKRLNAQENLVLQ